MAPTYHRHRHRLFLSLSLFALSALALACVLAPLLSGGSSRPSPPDQGRGRVGGKAGLSSPLMVSSRGRMATAARRCRDWQLHPPRMTGLQSLWQKQQQQPQWQQRRRVLRTPWAAQAASAADEDDAPDMDGNLERAEERMRKSITALQNSLMTVSTGRANPAMLDRVQVEYYGAKTPIRSLAGITTPSAQEIIVDPYDKGALAEVERAIFQANLGLTPSNDGKIIRISVPMLTEDRRKELAKGVKKYGEEAKVAIRNIRRDAIDFVKKQEKKKTISEDDSKYYQGEAQTLTDKLIKEVDAMISRKEKDLMEI